MRRVVPLLQNGWPGREWSELLATITALPVDVRSGVQASRDNATSRKTSRNTLLLIVCVALLLRLLFVCLTYRDLPASEHFERFGAEMGWTARSIALGRGFSSPFYDQTGPTALVCPLYPFLLAGIFKLFGVYSNASAFVALALNSIFSSATSAVIYFGMRQRFGFQTARCAAWLWALYPYAIYYSAVYLWDCALTSLLFACCFFLALNRLAYLRLPAWAGYACLCGLAALSNPSTLSLVPVFVCYALWRRSRSGRPVVPALGVFAAVLLLTLAPWSLRNVRMMHQPVLMRDGFWAEFYAGNAGDTSHSNPGWTHPASNPAEMQKFEQLGEGGYMAWKRTLSVRSVEQHPGNFLLTSARRVVRFWTGYWSFSHAYLADENLDVPNVPFCSLLTALTLLGLLRLWRFDQHIAALCMGVLLIFPLPYYVTHASMDYRQPIEPVVVALIAFAVVSVLGRRSNANAAIGRRMQPQDAAEAQV